MCRSEKNKVNSLDEEAYPNNVYSSDDEEDANVHLLHIASLQINGVSNKSLRSDEDERCETFKLGNSSLRCQLDTVAHANVSNISHLQQVEPNA